MTERYDLSTTIQELLNSPETRVNVIQAPPGLGKSHATMRAVLNALRTGRYQRVLWAVKDLGSDISLGQEALRTLRDLIGSQPAPASSIDLTMVLGQELATKYGIPPAESAARFIWPGSVPAIKVVSHARIARVFGPSPEADERHLRAADLIVIDEDPRSALLYGAESQPDTRRREEQQVKVNLQELRAHSPADPISQKLLNLMEQAAGPDGPALPGVRTYPKLPGRTREAYSLTGQAFHDAVLHGATLGDWQAFKQTLKELAVAQGRQVIAPWAMNLLRIQEPGSFALGLRWSQNDANVAFRFDVLRPVTFTQPVLILDAYASQEAYDLTFPGSTVALHTVGTRLPLHVRPARQLRLDSRDEGTGGAAPKREAHRTYVAREILHVAEQDADQRPVVVLASKLTANGHLQKLVAAELLSKSLPSDRVCFAHWHAGRGVNTFQGHHLFALEAPSLPRRHQDHTLAALAPTDPDARQSLYQHDLRSECLQMLHRTRQVLADTPESRPLIVTAFDVAAILGDTTDVVIHEPLTSHLEYTRKSKNPLLREALRSVTQELLDRLGGVPFVSLEAVGLLRPKSAPALRTRAANRLKTQVRKGTPLLRRLLS